DPRRRIAAVAEPTVHQVETPRVLAVLGRGVHENCPLRAKAQALVAPRRGVPGEGRAVRGIPAGAREKGRDVSFAVTHRRATPPRRVRTAPGPILRLTPKWSRRVQHPRPGQATASPQAPPGG